MASTESQKPTCPVCDRSDQVKTMQAAYDSGVARCAPPDMPTKNVPMLSYITLAIFLVGVCIVLIFVLIGSELTIGPLVTFPFTSIVFPLGDFILVTITLVCIVAALVISYMAFQKVVRGDAETTVLYPAWDRAMAKWRSLYYCSRDDVVFDPQAHQTVSNAQLASLRSMDEDQAEAQSAMMARHS